jgi:transcriptional regulator with XRE-family HTH domain
MLDKRTIGKQLKELRRSRGWRQIEVAERVGLSRSAVSNIESGSRALTLSTLKRFCEVYSIDISYFDIETKNFDEVTDLTTRLQKMFSEMPDDKKDELFREIMKIYLNNKK